MEPENVHMVTLLPCNDESCWEYVRKLRTKPSISKLFATQPEITTEQQIEYMKIHQHNYRIILLDEYFVGFIGHVDGDIRIAIDNQYQGKGIGSEAIELFVKEFKDVKLFAKVKIHNEKSINAFENAGFRKNYFIMEL